MNIDPWPDIGARLVWGGAFGAAAAWLFGATRGEMVAAAAGGALLAFTAGPNAAGARAATGATAPPPPPPPGSSITTPAGVDVNVSAHRDANGKIVWTVDPWVGP